MKPPSASCALHDDGLLADACADLIPSKYRSLRPRGTLPTKAISHPSSLRAPRGNHFSEVPRLSIIASQHPIALVERRVCPRLKLLFTGKINRERGPMPF